MKMNYDSKNPATLFMRAAQARRQCDERLSQRNVKLKKAFAPFREVLLDIVCTQRALEKRMSYRMFMVPDEAEVYVEKKRGFLSNAWPKFSNSIGRENRHDTRFIEKYPKSDHIDKDRYDGCGLKFFLCDNQFAPYLYSGAIPGVRMVKNKAVQEYVWRDKEWFSYDDIEDFKALVSDWLSIALPQKELALLQEAIQEEIVRNDKSFQRFMGGMGLSGRSPDDS